MIWGRFWNRLESKWNQITGGGRWEQRREGSEDGVPVGGVCVKRGNTGRSGAGGIVSRRVCERGPGQLENRTEEVKNFIGICTKNRTITFLFAVA